MKSSWLGCSASRRAALLQRARIGAACFALLAFACADGVDLESDRDGGTVAPSDAGSRDAGARDAGPYCGDDVCSDGCGGQEDFGERFVNCSLDCDSDRYCGPPLEGERCDSTASLQDPTLRQDNCLEADHLCVPWDRFAGREDAFFEPLHSCVKPCESHFDCAASRSCVSINYPGAPVEIPGFCVDDLAPPGKYCLASRMHSVRLASGERIAAHGNDEIVGCEGAARCVLGAASIRPDEGVCMLPCGDPDDPACPAASPHCAVVDVGTATVGACVEGPLGLGALCDVAEDPYRSPRLTPCDATGPAELYCLPLLGLPAGVCVEDCGPGDPCVSSDATNPVECRVVDATTGAGVCVHTNTDGVLESCEGPGAYGNGRRTTRVTLGVDRVEATWCTDRIRPLLTVGAIDTSGATVDIGDDCRRLPLDPYRCPASTRCIEREDQAQCLVECALDADDCAADLASVGLPATNATCLATGTSSVTGLCGGD